METLNYIGAQETLHPRLGFKELRQLAMPHIVSSRPENGLGLAVQRDNRGASHGEPSDQRRQRLVRPIAVAAPDIVVGECQF